MGCWPAASSACCWSTQSQFKVSVFHFVVASSGCVVIGWVGTMHTGPAQLKSSKCLASSISSTSSRFLPLDSLVFGEDDEVLSRNIRSHLEGSALIATFHPSLNCWSCFILFILWLIQAEHVLSTESSLFFYFLLRTYKNTSFTFLFHSTSVIIINRQIFSDTKYVVNERTGIQTEQLTRVRPSLMSPERCRLQCSYTD